jgi:hypothetical protein
LRPAWASRDSQNAAATRATATTMSSAAHHSISGSGETNAAVSAVAMPPSAPSARLVGCA